MWLIKEHSYRKSTHYYCICVLVLFVLFVFYLCGALYPFSSNKNYGNFFVVPLKKIFALVYVCKCSFVLCLCRMLMSATSALSLLHSVIKNCLLWCEKKKYVCCYQPHVPLVYIILEPGPCNRELVWFHTGEQNHWCSSALGY